MTGVEAFRNVSCVDGRDDEIRCKSPVAVDAKDGTVLTDMGVAFLATRAIPASEVALDGDQVANVVGRNPFPDGHDRPAGFVAGDGAQGDVVPAPFVPFPNVNVRAADGRGLGFDEDLAGARGRDGMLNLSEPTDLGPGLGPRRHGCWYRCHAPPSQDCLLGAFSSFAHDVLGVNWRKVR